MLKKFEHKRYVWKLLSNYLWLYEGSGSPSLGSDISKELSQSCLHSLHFQHYDVTHTLHTVNILTINASMYKLL